MSPVSLSPQSQLLLLSRLVSSQTVPHPPHKTLRLYCEGGVILVPLARDKTFIELFWTLDPKVHVSDYIVNFFTK